MERRIPEEPGSPSLLRPRTVGEILADAFHLYTRQRKERYSAADLERDLASHPG